jgi:hypothetical protein
MPDAKELLYSNLHEVFSEQDPERRRAAIERTYVEDVTFIDPEGEVIGRHALSDRAQKLLDAAPADFSLEEDASGRPVARQPAGSISSRSVMAV